MNVVADRTPEDRLRQLVMALLRLSEAGTMPLDREVHGKPQSTPPPGADIGRRGAPDPDDQLLSYFLWNWSRSKSMARRKALIAEVEIRLAKRVNGREARAVAGAIGTTAPSGYIVGSKSRSEHERRVAEDYRGFTPEEVSAIEGEAYGYCPVAYVRMTRIKAKRDAESGDPESASDRKDKRAHVLHLLGNGVSVRSCAIRAGLSTNTVQRWKRESVEEDAAKARLSSSAARGTAA